MLVALADGSNVEASETCVVPLVFCSYTGPAMFNGKPRAGNSREIPVSRETGGKSLSLGNSRVTGISRGSGNSRATRSSGILEATTFSSGIQIEI